MKFDAVLSNKWKKYLYEYFSLCMCVNYSFNIVLCEEKNEEY